MISLHLIGYLIIFLPLIACFLCLLINFPQSNFFIFATTSFLVVISSIILLLLLPDFNTHIVSDIDQRAVSLAINYNIGYLGLFFIILVSFVKFLTAIFYRNILSESLCNDGRKLFYALNLLNLFAVVGIFSTNNVINLYFFIEIYSFTFYAISCSSKETTLNKLAFKYLYQGSVGSILILISLLSLLINFQSANFDVIFFNIQNLYQGNQLIAISLIFIIFVIGVILKFFPFWIYFENIKSANFLSHFLSSRLLFVKVNIGFYLILKSLFLLFGIGLVFEILKLDPIIFVFAFLLIFYGNIKILTNNNLKVILSYYCLIYFGFFLISIAINDAQSLIAAISFIAHYSLIGLLLLLICGYMTYNYKNCNIKNLSFLKEGSLVIQCCFKILIPFICAFPLTFLFLANWHLIYVSLQPYYLMLVLVPLMTTFFVFANLSIKMISYFYFDSNIINKSTHLNNLQDNIYYLISFITAISIIILFAISPAVTLDIFRNLSMYLK